MNSHNVCIYEQLTTFTMTCNSFIPWTYSHIKFLLGKLLSTWESGVGEESSLTWEIRVMIQGISKQYYIQEAETGVNISLQDADGAFSTVKPIVVDLRKRDDPPKDRRN